MKKRTPFTLKSGNSPLKNENGGLWNWLTTSKSKTETPKTETSKGDDGGMGDMVGDAIGRAIVQGLAKAGEDPTEGMDKDSVYGFKNINIGRS